MFKGIYSGRRVLITGHTGFKGSWLSFFLRRLDAELCGVALPVPEDFHFHKLKMDFRSEMCDIRDMSALEGIFRSFKPEIIFHLAAQPLVRLSYREPAETFAVNVGGTINVMECCRRTPEVKALVVITTDKCYENPEDGRPFAEDAPLGGYDPYSASKAAAEIAVSSWNRSFFAPAGGVSCATARAGNVIGGGDWADDRLIPDMVRGAVKGAVTGLRNPASLRPWQHVLEPLSGYLWLGCRLWEAKEEFSGSWNFGPAENDTLTVGEVAEKLSRHWNKFHFETSREDNAPHEAALLRLDCRKAGSLLQWRGVWNSSRALERTALWYKDYCEKGILNTGEDLDLYCRDAAEKDLLWTK